MKYSLLISLVLFVTGCVPPPHWNIKEERKLASIDIECMRTIIASNTLVKGVVLNDPAIKHQKHNTGFYQFIIETEFGFANVGIYKRSDHWQVVSSTSGYSEVIPEKTQSLAPSFHEDIATGIKANCESAANK